MKKLILLLLGFVMSISLLAQKKVLIEDDDKIISAAISELDSAMQAPEGYFYLVGQKFTIKGAYTFDITIQEKGMAVSVFAVKNDKGTIDGQNTLKDYLRSYIFNFKMPKGKRYKFQYTFNYQ